MRTIFTAPPAPTPHSPTQKTMRTTRPHTLTPLLCLLGGFCCALPAPLHAEEKTVTSSSSSSSSVDLRLGKPGPFVAIEAGSVTVTGSEITLGAPGPEPGRQGLGITVNGSAISLGSSNASSFSDITITTIGPDGKTHTVRHTGGSDPHGRGVAIPGPDGKPLGLTFHKQPSRLEKVPYLGVNASETPEILSKHLPVPAGIGLVIQEIIKDSPAEKAGLQKDDVLLRLDDQLLANPPQLRTLTRAKKPGDKVRLSLLRNGKETALEVVIGEREEDIANPGPGSWLPFWAKNASPHGLPQIPEKTLEQTAQAVREALDQARDTARKLMRDPENTPPTGAPRPPGPPPSPRAMHQKLDHLEEEIGRLRAELNRLSRENPEKHAPRNRGAHSETPPEGRENSGENAGPRRPPGTPPAPKPEGQ